MKKALLNLLGTCIVRLQYVQICFACAKRHSSLLNEATIIVVNARSRVKRAIFFLKNKQQTGDLHFGRDEKITSSCFWRCVLSNRSKQKLCLLFNQEIFQFLRLKKCKACTHVLNVPFKDEKSTTMLFSVDGTHCFAKKTCRDYEKEKPSPFLKKLLDQSEPSASKPKPKKAKIIPFMA